MKTLAWILSGVATLFVLALAGITLAAVYAAEELRNKARIAPAAANRWPKREPDLQPEKMEAVPVDLKDGMKVNSIQDEKVS
jgi:hypothetical protein